MRTLRRREASSARDNRHARRAEGVELTAVWYFSTKHYGPVVTDSFSVVLSLTASGTLKT